MDLGVITFPFNFIDSAHKFVCIYHSIFIFKSFCLDIVCRIQRNKNTSLKFDQKYYVFGEKPERETWVI